MSVNLCLATLAVILCAHSVSALHCYSCNSNRDQSCMQDVPPENFKQDCAEYPEGPKYTLCRKIVQHVDFEVNGLQPDHRVIRTCGWENSSYTNRCYQRAGFGGRQEVCSCTSDYCNSAPPRMALPSLLTIVMYTVLRTLLF